MITAESIAREFHIANSELVMLWTAPNGTPMVTSTRGSGWSVRPVRSPATEPQP